MFVEPGRKQEWPAAAVIPAPIAYVKIAAVKKLVVGLLVWCAEPALLGECLCAPTILLESVPVLHWIGYHAPDHLL